MLVKEEPTRQNERVDQLLMILWALFLWCIAAAIAASVFCGVLCWCAIAWCLAFDGYAIPDLDHTVQLYASVPTWVYAVGSGPAALTARYFAVAIPRTLNGWFTSEAVFPPKWRV
jgi:hypothetical protein